MTPIQTAASTALANQSVQHLSGLLGLSQSELAEILEVSPSTMSRRTLKPPEAERLAVLGEITELAQQLVPDEHVAEWLAQPKAALSDRAPKLLLRSERGRRKVETFLLRAIHGGG